VSTSKRLGGEVVREIGRDDVERLVEDGAQLVEVLPEREYEELHLRGAINLPLKQLTRERATELDKDRPVVLYCWDSL
jgi:rhodanese-related sulfurtransferase